MSAALTNRFAMTNSSLQSGSHERSDEQKVRLCAANNADLYQAIFRAHGLPDQRTGAFWTSDAVAPPYYSKACRNYSAS
ncbi:hypothetical protein CO670_18125 [Rhizobium sp. J15]|nr:hypothetical protein CO670_18125 [Rhizobium sp. J15]